MASASVPRGLRWQAVDERMTINVASGMNARMFRCSSVLLLCLTGCVANTTTGRTKLIEFQRPPSQFPSQEVLARVPAIEIGAALDDLHYLEVDHWELQGPFPEPLLMHTPSTAWDQLLSKKIANETKRVQTTEGMFCAAREMGLFVLENTKYPSASLSSFMTGRCGALLPETWMLSLSGEVPAGVSDEEVFNHWKPQIEEMFAKLPAGPQNAGLWLGRKGNRAVMMFTGGARFADVSAIERTETKLTIRGELLVPADRQRALINRGRFGVESCEADVNEVLPKFALVCALDRNDDEEWIEYAALPPGHELGKTVLQVLTSPSGKAPSSYGVKRPAAPTPTDSLQSIDARLVEEINAVRSSAGMKPVEREEEQCEVARQVAPHYFASALGTLSTDVAETVALGLRAGWNVQGPVRYAGFASTGSINTDDPLSLLEHSLARPFAREVLLDPKARKIAIGSYLSAENNFVGAIMSTYVFMEKEPQDALRRQVLARINQIREKASLTPARFESKFEDAEKSTDEQLAQEKIPSNEGFDYFLQAAARRSSKTVRGWVYETSMLSELVLPEELLRRVDLEVAIVVTTLRPDNEPWTRYIVMVVVEESKEQVTASL